MGKRKYNEGHFRQDIMKGCATINQECTYVFRTQQCPSKYLINIIKYNVQ